MKFTKRRILIGATLLATPFLAAVLIQREALAPQFCSVCLLRQDGEAWRLRFAERTLFERHHESPTPISALLAHKQVCPPHEHRWQGPQAFPNPLDPSAPHVVQSFEFVNTPRVVNFLRDVLNYADADSVRRWKEVTLTLENSALMDDTLRFCRFPVEGFADQSSFMAWWNRGGAAAVAKRIRQETIPD